MNILTASHGSKPSLTDYQVGRGFAVLDITIKSGCDDGWILAPSWGMVSEYKSGSINEYKFRELYQDLITKRWNRLFPDRIERLSRMNLILVCYCPAGEFCHRYLAAEFLVNEVDATYYGEHQIS